jgi:hypothetical protein
MDGILITLAAESQKFALIQLTLNGEKMDVAPISARAYTRVLQVRLELA